jgi:hypothetical protein
VLAVGLDAAPGFVRGVVGRLLPQLGPGGGPSLGGRDGGWEQERLFAGVAELLSAVAAGSGAGVGLVVEDVHWADTATLDLLTFLARPSRRGGVRVVVTCRGDEAPLAGRWRAGSRGCAVRRGWWRLPWARCRGRRPPSRSLPWLAGRCRRRWWMGCSRGRRETRFSPSSWWPQCPVVRDRQFSSSWSAPASAAPPTLRARA